MSKYTIEKDPRGATYKHNGTYAVYEHGVYEESSVLAGEPRRTFMDFFDTLEEAQKEYPEAEVIDGSTYRETPIINDPIIDPNWDIDNDYSF